MHSGNSGARNERRNWKFLRRNDGGVSEDEVAYDEIRFVEILESTK